jgi:hypothetical protein
MHRAQPPAILRPSALAALRAFVQTGTASNCRQVENIKC